MLPPPAQGTAPTQGRACAERSGTDSRSAKLRRSWQVASVAMTAMFAFTAGPAWATPHTASADALAAAAPLVGAILSGRPVGVAQTPIKHVIFILKENRSYDNYFGKFPN